MEGKRQLSKPTILEGYDKLLNRDIFRWVCRHREQAREFSPEYISRLFGRGNWLLKVNMGGVRDVMGVGRVERIDLKICEGSVCSKLQIVLKNWKLGFHGGEVR